MKCLLLSRQLCAAKSKTALHRALHDYLGVYLMLGQRGAAGKGVGLTRCEQRVRLDLRRLNLLCC
jgi:hypothetical protein